MLRGHGWDTTISSPVCLLIMPFGVQTSGLDLQSHRSGGHLAGGTAWNAE